MATEPMLLLLDEPTAGMNPRETLELRDHIVRMRDELGLTVVGDRARHARREGRLRPRHRVATTGRRSREGTYEEVANDEQVIEAYLGTKAVG